MKLCAAPQKAAHFLVYSIRARDSTENGTWPAIFATEQWIDPLNLGQLASDSPISTWFSSGLVLCWSCSEGDQDLCSPYVRVGRTRMARIPGCCRI